jgi:hypothetical protein
VDWAKIIQALPKWVFVFLAFIASAVIVHAMVVAKCRTQLFGLSFGPDQSCDAPITSLPQGTVLAWDPVERDGKGKATRNRLQVPRGWVVCGTAASTPDLTGRFLVGTSSLQDAGKIGGTATIVGGAHTHSGSTDRVGAEAGRPCSGNCYPPAPSHSHKFSTDPGGEHAHGDNRPPFYSVVYLCQGVTAAGLE